MILNNDVISSLKFGQIRNIQYISSDDQMFFKSKLLRLILLQAKMIELGENIKIFPLKTGTSLHISPFLSLGLANKLTLAPGEYKIYSLLIVWSNYLELRGKLRI